jgi:uncharacterized heparinase superfamily protein
VAPLAAQRLQAVLRSWLEANRPLTGVHHVSAMECALRLIAVCHALDLARPALGAAGPTWTGLVQLVAGHAALIRARLSLHSSAGNHTIAEAAGLVYAGVLFPELPGAAAWLRRGLELLAAEAPRQVLPDGGGVEQATRYLAFVQELLELVTGLLELHGLPVAAGVRAAADRARAFLAAIAAQPGVLPALGDGDDGCALAPWFRPGWQRSEPATAALQTFPDAGYTVLRAPAAQLQVVMDHGPLGMLPACGHGHADALSIIVQRRGREVLLDPGTFTYTGNAAWRHYFRSTAAHNTVVVNGADQSVQQAAFIWAEPYCCELVQSAAAGAVRRLLARHDGYQRRHGVTHWRGVALHDNGAVVVWDRLEGAGRADLSARWHTPVAAAAGEGRWSLGDGLLLEVKGAEAVVCQVGSGNGSGGWRSSQYGQKEPVSTLSADWSGDLPHEFIACLDTDPRSLSDTVLQQDVDQFRRWCP